MYDVAITYEVRLTTMKPDGWIKHLMAELNNEHLLLQELVAETQPKFIAFDIETISKKDEPDVIANGITSLDVSSLEQWHHLRVALGFWSKYYKEDGVSTQFVERMPGLVAVSSKQQDVKNIVEHINSLKIQIAQIVREGRNHVQRHEFIHETFPRIMTDQLYRKIHVIDNPVQRAWFNWTSRPIPKSLNNDQAVALLSKHEDRPLGLATGSEWRLMIKAQINDIKNGAYTNIYIKKDFRLLPVLTYKEVEGDAIVKRKTKNGCTPILLLGQENGILPSFTHLESYHKPLSSNLVPLDMPGKVYINSHLKMIGNQRS